MDATETILLALKEQALAATKNRDGAFYRDYLDDNAIAIVPAGVFDKETIIQQMTDSQAPFQSSRIDDTRVMVLTPESGVVTYTATFDAQHTEQPTSVSMFVTTIYVKRNGTWKGVFYQQTPLLQRQE